ncbi:hypothetical protein KC355_g3723 [Hortaea werneckii]|nr:hypothetical protein KC355_g3723 [Hortaea werneckii]
MASEGPAPTAALRNANGMHAPATNGEEDHIASIWTRYEHLKYSDVMKNVLLEDVISRYENLHLKHKNYVRENEAGSNTAVDYKKKFEEACRNLQHLQGILNRNPFVLVLIDGDGLVFNTDFLAQGEKGGKRAAAFLYQAIRTWALREIIEMPEDFRIAVKVYANMKSLAENSAKAGLVNNTAEFENFAHGFTCGNDLFEFIDVGPGNGKATGKMAEILKLHLYDYHCRQIIFGCSQDYDYARLLGQYALDREALSRVTLLETVAFGNYLKQLEFKTIKFPGVFHETQPPVVPPGLLTGPLNTNAQTFRPRVESCGLSATSEVFTPRTASPFSSFTSSGAQLHQLDGQVLAQRLPHLRSTSMTSSAESSDSGAAGLGSWAAITKASSALPYTEIPKASRPFETAAKTISRNIRGQRIDEPMDYDKDEVQRLKRIKMCNQHYIGQGCCHYNAGRSDKCPHRHDIKLTPQERQWLRVVARETPCKKGTECDDVKCIYGHRCPFPVATEGSSRGSGMCLNGENCRFPRDMHITDTKIVKTTRITGTF